MTIPKIIHQLWIGHHPAPIKLMNTWKEKHPDFEYIYWNEHEFQRRNFYFTCQDKIDDIEEIHGKADIMRLEILYEYGGIYLDADSICIEPIDEELLSKSCFAGWEQETIRPGLIANGTMGFPKNHPLVKAAIEWIKTNEVSKKSTGLSAWQTVGPLLLTRMYNTGLFPDFHVFPSYTFIPIHFTGIQYNGHGKVYAFQAWGSTLKSYDSMNNILVPSELLTPSKENGVTILIPSYNTSPDYITECLDSIKDQVGYFNIELIWINDGSDNIHTESLKKILDHFLKTTRFTKVIYCENDTTRGLGYTLHKGVDMASYELIFRMDSDDIMVGNRIITQAEYMNNNKDVVICGTQIAMFIGNRHNIVSVTDHPSIVLNSYKQNPLHWIVNHPTVCFRKSSIVHIGNYNINLTRNIEDFELWLRILKEYGYIHNLKETLLYYRLHESQLTHNGGKEGSIYWHDKRLELITNLINS
uniref:Glycosyltransferase 2-like domain-containing protein n=1 Tax=viral metagenome TaxID=1070528 RepID=A0A6C0E1W1_9ZZZZ